MQRVNFPASLKVGGMSDMTGRPPHSITRIILVLSASACAYAASASTGPDGTDFSPLAISVLLASLALFAVALTVQIICTFRYRPLWFESVFPAVVGGGILVFSYLWTIPLRDTPTIFHPALFFQVTGVSWVVLSLIAAFRRFHRSSP